jgi:hypothetical protein
MLGLQVPVRQIQGPLISRIYDSNRPQVHRPREETLTI